MWWWLWIIWLFILFWLVLLPFGWGYRRWGRPVYRYHRGHYHAVNDLDPAYQDESYETTETGWAWWSAIIWLILTALVVWLIVAIWI